jgi:hypothetical protein
MCRISDTFRHLQSHMCGQTDDWEQSTYCTLSTVWNTVLCSVYVCVKLRLVLARSATPKQATSLRCGLAHVAGLQLIMTICVSTDWIKGEYEREWRSPERCVETATRVWITPHCHCFLLQECWTPCESALLIGLFVTPSIPTRVTNCPDFFSGLSWFYISCTE